MNPFTNRRIYDSDDENWKGNRKKFLHDPMNVQKDSNKDIGESSKSKVAKIHQKRRKASTTIIFRPTLLRVCLFYTSFKIVVKLVKI